MDKPATALRRSLRLQEWVERWNGGLTRFLRRQVPSAVDAQDLAQEVYLRLLRVEHLDEIQAPEAYLYHVARNTAIEWRARARQSQPHSAEELDALVELSTPEDLVQGMIEERALNAALARLPVNVRAAVYLKLRDGKTHDEIARHLSVTNRVVRKYLTAGYSALRHQYIKERGA